MVIGFEILFLVIDDQLKLKLGKLLFDRVVVKVLVSHKVGLHPTESGDICYLRLNLVVDLLFLVIHFKIYLE